MHMVTHMSHIAITSYAAQHLGTYDTLLEARRAYQEFTICKMRDLANTYADVISDKVYNALIN